MKAISRSAASTLRHMSATLGTLCAPPVGPLRIIDELRQFGGRIATGLGLGGVVVQTPDVQGVPTLPPTPPRMLADESRVASSSEEAGVESTESRLDLSHLTQLARTLPAERIGVFNTAYLRLMGQVNQHARLIAHPGTSPEQRQRSVEIVIDAVDQIYDLLQSLLEDHKDNGGGNPAFSAGAHRKLADIAAERVAWANRLNRASDVA